MPESRTSISSPENFPCVLSTCTITPFGACAGRYFLAVIPILQPALRPASSTRVRKAVARVMVIASIHRNAILHKARLEGFARGAPLPQRAEYSLVGRRKRLLGGRGLYPRAAYPFRVVALRRKQKRPRLPGRLAPHVENRQESLTRIGLEVVIVRTAQAFPRCVFWASVRSRHL